MKVVLRQAWSESQWIVSVRYLTISINVRRYQTHYRRQFLFQEDRIVRATQSICCSTLDEYKIWVKNVIFVFSRSARYCRSISYLTWHSKASFDCILCLWHLCQRLSKFVYVCQSYSNPNVGHILRHGVAYQPRRRPNFAQSLVDVRWATLVQ